MDKPILRRDIQPIVTAVSGRRMVVFHDPYHLADHRIALDFNTLPILQMLDGQHDLADIQAMLTRRQGGRIAYASEIASFIESLDKAFLLESPSFNKKMRGIRNEFGSRQVRLPVHAGRSYLADPRELARFIEDAEDSLGAERPSIPDRITGILAPHIDINVAKDAYVDAYSHLKGRSYDTVVILGINHHPQDGLYSLSEKHYATPFGEIKADVDFVKDLRKSLPEGTFAPDDFGHMMEHSIEFQTVFLGHYLAGPFKMVPLLCGGVHEFIFKDGNILADERFRGMVSATKHLLTERNGLVVAGVDLSHVGRKFGDPAPADILLPHATAHDRALLSFVGSGEPENIFQKSVENRDVYHVCGLPAILLFASLLAGDHADMLRFSTYNERETESAVNYASLIMRAA